MDEFTGLPVGQAVPAVITVLIILVGGALLTYVVKSFVIELSIIVLICLTVWEEKFGLLLMLVIIIGIGKHICDCSAEYEAGNISGVFKLLRTGVFVALAVFFIVKINT